MEYRRAIVVIFWIFCVDFGTCDLYFYGPSIELLTRGSSPPRTQADILKNVYYHTRAKKVLSLADYAPTYNVLIPLVPGKSFVNRTEALKHFKLFHQGTFLVEAPPAHGIIASLQVLRLNTGSVEPIQCIDYIQFAELTNESPGNEDETQDVIRRSPKICGEDDVDNFQPQPEKLIGPASFVAESGRMSVSVLILSTRILTAWSHALGESFHSHLEKLIALEITFTAFPVLEKLEIISAANGNAPSWIDNESNNSSNATGCPFQSLYDKLTNRSIPLRQCSSSRSSDSIYCIHEALFCDNSIHCAFDFNETVFASDETHCGGDGSLQKLSLNVEEDPSASNLTFVNGTRKLNPKLIIAPKALGFKFVRMIVIFFFIVFILALLVGLWWGLRLLIFDRNVQVQEFPLDNLDNFTDTSSISSKTPDVIRRDQSGKIINVTFVP